MEGLDSFQLLSFLEMPCTLTYVSVPTQKLEFYYVDFVKVFVRNCSMLVEKKRHIRKKRTLLPTPMKEIFYLIFHSCVA